MNEQFNKKPLVSVIVNCFNGSQYLKATLDSILNQTYKYWEIIFWDNQSTDDSAKIFKKYKDERFKYYYAPQHTTLYHARNEAIKKTSGEIIAFLDTDDWWNENKLERQISFFEDEKVGLVYSNFYLFYENSKKIKIYNKKILKSGYITKNIFKNFEIGILTVLIRKVAYNSVLGFNNQYNFIGDFDLFIRLSSKWKIDCVQEPLAYYRIHNNNFSFVNNVNNVVEIEELEKWILDEKIISDKNLIPYLHHVNKRIVFIKTIKYVNEGKLFKALKNIVFFPIGFNKIKLILYVILPKKFYNKIGKFNRKS